jgi:hypothetical protein
VSLFNQIDSYFKPNGRSGTLSPSERLGPAREVVEERGREEELEALREGEVSER